MIQLMCEQEREARADLFDLACRIAIAQTTQDAVEVRRLKAKRSKLRRRLRKIGEAEQRHFDFYDEEIW